LARHRITIDSRTSDTAGLRETECHIEQEGVRRAQDHIERADVIVHVIDASQELSAEDRQFSQDTRQQAVIVVLNKSDLGRAVPPDSFADRRVVSCSLLHDGTVEHVRNALANVLGIHAWTPPHAVIAERHRAHIQFALDELNEVHQLVAGDRDDMVVVATAGLRRALEQLGLIIGKTYTDEMMDAIFSRFCIGK
jgi:tRNA modification GTPase